MIYLESILTVLVVGLILGAGLPAVFARAGGLFERCRRHAHRRHRPGAQPGAEVPRTAAVRVGRRGDRDRDAVDNQDDDHSSFRIQSRPVHPGEVSGDQPMTETPRLSGQRAAWLHEGYPEGVPPKDYFAVLALLKRSLTEEEVIKAAQAILKSNADDP